MRKNILIAITFLVLGAFPALAFAEGTANTTVGTTPTTTQTTDSTVTISPKPHTERTTTLLNDKVIPTLHQELKDARKDFHSDMVQARTDFREKIKTIKDEKKQTIMTNLDERLKTLNKKRTDEMTERLTRLTAVLTKISSKEAVLKTQGKNTTTLDTDIAAATTAIATAQTAVMTQAAKDYVVDITTDTALKGAASTTILQYKTDILAVYQLVIAAQGAVVKTYKDVNLLMGTGITPTPSATVTPTP